MKVAHCPSQRNSRFALILNSIATHCHYQRRPNFPLEIRTTGLYLLPTGRNKSSLAKTDMYSEKLPKAKTDGENPISYCEKTHLYFEKRYLAYFCSGHVRVYILLPRRKLKHTELHGDLYKTQGIKYSYGSCQCNLRPSTDGAPSPATSLLAIRPYENVEAPWAPYDSQSTNTTSCWLKKAFTNALGQVGTRATKFRGVYRNTRAHRYQQL